MDTKSETIVTETVSAQTDALSEKKNKQKDKTPKPRKNKKKLIRNCIIIVLVLAIVSGAYMFMTREKKEEVTALISANAATRGDVTVHLSGSGMIEALESYDIVAMVQGDILSSPFEEGQIVNEDDILYVFDSEDAQQSLQSQQNNYDSQKISYEAEQKKWEKFTVEAPVSGYVKDIAADLSVGDEVGNGMKLATVNSASVEVTIPFAASAASSVSVGSSVQLSSSKYMTNNIYGTVTGVDKVYGGSFNVTVVFDNPGQIEEGDVFCAQINGMLSSGTGTCRVAHAVETEIKGEIAQIHVKNGDYVTKGTLLFTLDDDDTKNNLRQNQISFENAGISLQKAYDALDNYTIKSPITGTVIQKNYKAGDTLGMSSNSAILATIADISKMTFTINVDELDISKVEVGQKVDVTADAIANKVFEGTVTKIIQQGSGASGVTTYPVEVTIDEPGELKIGMNVTGTIVVSSAKNVIKVPLEAVNMRGGKTYVYVLKDDVRKEAFGDVKAEDSAAQKERPQGEVPQGELPQGERTQGERPQGERPQGERTQGERPQGERTQSNTANANTKKNGENAYEFKDEDFVEREVTIGVSSDSEIEIKDGLSVGEYVKVVKIINTNTNNGLSMFGNMRGGMGGGMQSGGMGSGMPSGGNMRGGMSGSTMRSGASGGMQGGR